MFNPSFFVILNHKKLVIPSCWSCFDPITKFLTQNKVIHIRQPIFVENKAFIFWNTSTKSMFWKKGKDGWSLTKPRDGNEKFVSKWPRNNKSCAWINSWKNYASRKIFISFITTILSNFAQRHYLPKQTKKCENFKANWIEEQKSLKPMTLVLSVVNWWRLRWRTHKNDVVKNKMKMRLVQSKEQIEKWRWCKCLSQNSRTKEVSMHAWTWLKSKSKKLEKMTKW